VLISHAFGVGGFDPTELGGDFRTGAFRWVDSSNNGVSPRFSQCQPGAYAPGSPFIVHHFFSPSTAAACKASRIFEASELGKLPRWISKMTNKSCFGSIHACVP
jgi:hypothetical protein